MENQNNQNNGTDSLIKLGVLGAIAYGIGYLFAKGSDIRENPDEENDTVSKKSEPETVKKSVPEVDEDVTMKVRKSAEHEKGNWLAILCRADGQESDQCFFGDTKKETIEKAFKEAISCYKEVLDD